ncbi:hypothetical protein, conserved [Plasmodium vivax]|uniref:Uncharacterized protein n=1 Tax=Plasmodium vivax (strain Salvador I) TaxID=126793 RepID=A5K9Y7_PLAVS|nr:hypothetical protein, conserved [Plasmodium vivax]EDL43875.1 hypothetical protein, conserved [Plasmodium vivax]|eukprot:XP_001613602.1 hypothetical protein [Plasmodium vivax Sal-1]
MNNSYDTYNYSSSIFNSPGKSSMLSSSSQNLSGSYGYSSLSSQNEVINTILEQCVQEWFPFLREHEGGGTKGEGNKRTNVNEEIKRLKNFYRGVNTPNFPLKKLGKMDRSISSLNDENDDEDIFYNSNSLYMNLLSGGEEGGETRHEGGAARHEGGEEDDALFNQAFTRAKDNTREESEHGISGRNALEENLFYDCIAEREGAHNKGGNMDAMVSAKVCNREDQLGEGEAPVWSLQKIRNHNEDEKKNFYLQKCRDQMSEKKEHKVKQPLALLQWGKKENDNDSDDDQQGEEVEEEKYKLLDRVNEPSGGRTNRSEYNSRDTSAVNSPQSRTRGEEEEEEEEQCPQRKSDVRDPTAQRLSSKEEDITPQGYLSSGRKERASKVSKLADSQNGGDNCSNRESVPREDYSNKSINCIIQEIKKEESKEKKFTMDSYGTVYLSICTKVLEKNVDYFLTPRMLPNEELLNEKKKIKEILKLYDKLFYSHFKFIPNKIYKETLRPIYSYYQNLKCTLVGGGASIGSFDGKSRKSCSLSRDYEIERSTNYNSHDEMKSFESRPADSSECKPVGSSSSAEYKPVGSSSNVEYKNLGSPSNVEYKNLGSPSNVEYKNMGSSSNAEYKSVGSSSNVEYKNLGSSPNAEYKNLGSFSNLINDQNIKKILIDVDDSKDITHLEKEYKYIYKDLVKLKSLLLKKRHYKNILFEYQKKFVQNNNRCVKTYRDIYPVEKEYKIYTQIKKETGDVINSINANYKKHYLNG